MARPQGSTESPGMLVRRDLKESLKQQKEIRDLFASQLEKIREELENNQDLSIRERLEIMSSLAEMSESLTKSIAQTAKWVMPQGGEDEGKTVDFEKILRELTEGRM